MPAFELVQRTARLIESELGGVSRLDFEQVARDRFAPQRAQEQWDILTRYVTLPSAPRLLEVGCSFGTFQAFLRGQGVQNYGIEPSFEALSIGYAAWGESLAAGSMINAFGETLPFRSGAFDAVFSSNVFEHVQDPSAVLREGLRVLKTGGYLHFVFPNYGSIWDGHYSLPWIPYAPAWLGKAYVSLFGRDPAYVDSLQLLNIFKLRALLKQNPSARVTTWGDEVFAERLTAREFKEWSGMNGLGRAVRLIQKSGLARVAAWTGKQFALYTPFILTLHKGG
jgi:SAM-dependent methyltransferase